MLSDSRIKSIRSFLLMFAFLIAYLSAFTMGAIVVIRIPWVSSYIDLTIFMLSALGILFIGLFYGIYERNVNITLSERTKKIVELYGEGKSFQYIKDELDLPNISTVKQELSKFCKLKR